MLVTERMGAALQRRLQQGCKDVLQRVMNAADCYLLGQATLYRWIPPGIGDAAAHRLADLAWRLQDRLPVHAWRLQGPHWSMVYAGSPQGLRVMRHLFFTPQVQPVVVARQPLPVLAATARRWLDAGVDLVVLESSRLAPPAQAAIRFAVPTWVNQLLLLPREVEALLEGSRVRGLRGSINKAIKAGYTARYSRKQADFEHFYRHIYLPSARRHGDLAVIGSYARQHRVFSRGGLIVVERGGQAMAGGLSYIARHTCFGVEGGIRDGSDHLRQQGVNVFLMWSNIRWAHRQGVRRFNMGGTRPWLSNGGFAFKRKWGARVVQRQRPYGFWSFLADSLSAPLRAHIEAIGFIVEHQDRFWGLQTAGPPPGQTAHDAARSAGLAGVLCLDDEACRPAPGAVPAALQPAFGKTVEADATRS